MIVFVDGVPDKSRYRSFKVKGLTGDGEGKRQGSFQNDDFASMYEVLGRRFKRALRGGVRRDAGRSDSEDDIAEDVWALPDLIVIDGGKGQLGRVVAAMQDLGIALGAEGVEVVSLAKERKNAIPVSRAGLAKLKGKSTPSSNTSTREVARPGRSLEDWTLTQGEGEEFEVRPERVFLPGGKDPIALRPGSSERYLMERVRDEAHRFAITLHRKRRGKRAIRSSLDDIEGIGPALKRALVGHFGSITKIKAAEVEELIQVKGVGKNLAQRIRSAFGE